VRGRVVHESCGQRGVDDAPCEAGNQHQGEHQRHVLRQRSGDETDADDHFGDGHRQALGDLGDLVEQHAGEDGGDDEEAEDQCGERCGTDAFIDHVAGELDGHDVVKHGDHQEDERQPQHLPVRRLLLRGALVDDVALIVDERAANAEVIELLRNEHAHEHHGDEQQEEDEVRGLPVDGDQQTGDEQQHDIAKIADRLSPSKQLALHIAVIQVGDVRHTQGDEQRRPEAEEHTRYENRPIVREERRNHACDGGYEESRHRDFLPADGIGEYAGQCRADHRADRRHRGQQLDVRRGIVGERLLHRRYGTADCIAGGHQQRHRQDADHQGLGFQRFANI
ncbi:hypothetical protein BIFLH665_00335, partial [Bifidobacterium longum subsp. infantis]